MRKNILEKKVEKLEEKVDDHEKRISNLEGKFDFIKNSLIHIGERLRDVNPKKWKVAFWIMISILFGMIIAIIIGGTNV